CSASCSSSSSWVDGDSARAFLAGGCLLEPALPVLPALAVFLGEDLRALAFALAALGAALLLGDLAGTDFLRGGLGSDSLSLSSISLAGALALDALALGALAGGGFFALDFFEIAALQLSSRQ